MDISPFFRSNSESHGLHALLIGVSHYPFADGGEEPVAETFGIGQLSAPARTVIDLAELLRDSMTNLAFPLRTIRVLASPSQEEIKKNISLATLPPATLENVQSAAKAWQADAATSRNNATLFYFAGHGIQRSRGDSVLLLEDFLKPKGAATDLAYTVNVNNIYNGMANFRTFPKLANTQFYFIDACRSDILNLRDFETQETAPIFKVEAGGIDDRIAPVFFASAAGRETYGVKGGLTLFGEDLIACLKGSASDKLIRANGQKGWFVTIGTLADAMSKMVNAFNARMPIPIRSLNVDKFTATALEQIICELKAPPKVRCTLNLKPPEVSQFASIRFDRPGVASPMLICNPSNPHSCVVDAGIYAIDAFVPSTLKSLYPDLSEELVNVKPPFFDYALRFA